MREQARELAGEATWIDDRAGMEALATRMQAAKHIGLDSESNSMHVYRERVCLVQLAVDEELVLIDPFAFDEAARALDPIAPVLRDPERDLVLHGGEYDVAVFKRAFDIPLRGVFDTQQAASHLGWPSTGLGAVVERVCGVPLAKAYARYDWGERPLDLGALRYALDDVRYLAQMHGALREAVREGGIEEEVAIANQAVEDAAEHSQNFDPAGFWRVKGVRDLDAAGKRRAQTLWQWRESAAQRADRPPGRLVNNQQLLALARRGPKDAKALSRCGLPGWLRRREGEGIVAAVAEADAPELELIAAPKPARMPPELRAREKKLKAWRRAESESRGVPLAVVLPARTLAWLAEDPTRDWDEAPMFGAGRRARYEAALRAALGL